MATNNNIDNWLPMRVAAMEENESETNSFNESITLKVNKMSQKATQLFRCTCSHIT